ncbi:hypothetical protein [Streptosporangium sp. OZ121]|uniref:hypothetical protein n=1 Tax=Streptosporangium sp. OZ121 TaxID=3444183 RepID=UPI003F7A40FA
MLSTRPNVASPAAERAPTALDEDTRARERLSSALNRLNSGRTRTGLRCRTRLAVLHMRAGDREAGEREARQAVRDATGVRSRRVASDLRMMVSDARAHGMNTLADDLTHAMGQAASVDGG